MSNETSTRVSQPAAPLRIVYFGTLGAFSLPPLQALLRADADVRAVVIPAQAPQTADIAPWLPARPAPRAASVIPLAHDPIAQTVGDVAGQRAVPVYTVARFSPDTRDQCAAWQPDVICVACFPLRLPAWLLQLPRYGALNVHPSLLPAHRGPVPQFWVFRAGEQHGVTIHFMDQTFDTGPIAAQSTLDLPDGISGGGAEHRSAQLGGQLLVQTLDQLARGTLVQRPQPANGSNESWPSDEDFSIPTHWSARRAFNFMRGTAEWNQPYRIAVGGEPIIAIHATSVQPDGRIGAPVIRQGNTAQIQFTPGVLHVALG